MKYLYSSKKITLKFCFVASMSMCFALPLLVANVANATDANAWQPAEMPRFNVAGLARPMAPTTLQLLFNEAESAYRSKRTAQAAETLQGLIELEPAATAAWFRLGNIWQSQGQTQWAIFAYKQAAQTEAIALPAQPADVRQKALLNLAALHLQGSRAALDLIQSEGSQSTHLAEATHRVADQIEAQTGQASVAKQALLDRAERVDQVAQVTDSTKGAKGTQASRSPQAVLVKGNGAKASKQNWIPAKNALLNPMGISQNPAPDQKVQLFSGQTR